MWNARRWRSRVWSWRSGRWHGRLARLVLVLLISATFSACASRPATPVYRPALPPRPELTAPIRDLRVEGQDVVIVGLEDWKAIGQWALTLERELTAACLALGGALDACRPPR